MNLLNSIRIDWNKIDPDSYLCAIKALKNLNELTFTHPITFFAGENGSGKSTLLEAIAIAWGFNPEGGSVNYSFSTFASHSDLYRALTLARSPRKAEWGYFLRAESFYNVSTQEIAYADSAHPSAEYHKMSHGEGFLELVHKQFASDGFYILDEPEAALSPQHQLSLLYELHCCVKEGSQFIIATHSPILLGMPDAQILNFDHDRIQPCSYEKTDSYRITRMFLDRKEDVLRHLFQD